MIAPIEVSALNYPGDFSPRSKVDVEFARESLGVAIDKGAVTASLGGGEGVYAINSRESTPLIRQQATLYSQSVTQRAALSRISTRRMVPLQSRGAVELIGISEYEIHQAAVRQDPLILSSCSGLSVGQNFMSIPSLDYLGRSEDDQAHIGMSIVFPDQNPDIYTTTALIDCSEQEVAGIMKMYRYVMETVIRRNVLGINGGHELLFETVSEVDPEFARMEELADSDIRHQLNNSISTTNLYYNLLTGGQIVSNIPKYLLTLLNTAKGINSYLGEILLFCSDQLMDMSQIVLGARDLAYLIRTDVPCQVEVEISDEAREIQLPANAAIQLSELIGNAMVNGADSVIVSSTVEEVEAIGETVVLEVANDNTVIPLEDNRLGHIFEFGYTDRPKSAPPGGGLGLHSLDQFAALYGGEITVSTVHGNFQVRHNRNYFYEQPTTADEIVATDSVSRYSTSFRITLPLSA